MRSQPGSMPGAVGRENGPGEGEGEGELVELLVVMPVLNEAASLAESLRALQPLRRRGASLVVVDGGSTDGSVAIADPLADRTLSAARGRASQMNAGAAAQLCRVMLFLHADTRLPDGADERILEAIAEGHAWGRFDVRIDSDRPSLRLVGWLMNLRSRLTGIATGDQAVFMTGAAFRAAGGFPALALMEDIEMSRRLKRIARPACLRARVLTSARRWEQGGVWRTVWLMWRLRAAYSFGADPARLARRYGHGRPEQR